MAFRFALSRPLLRPRLRSSRARCYATVAPITLVGKVPGPPQVAAPPAMAAPAALDALILSELRRSHGTSLPMIVQQYLDRSGDVLDSSLPYESRPNDSRRVRFDNSDGVVLVAHAMQHGDAYKVALCTGFVLNVAQDDGNEERTVILSCAHTLEEMRNSTLFSSVPTAGQDTGVSSAASGSFVLTTSSRAHPPSFYTVQNVLSSLHRSDLLLLSTESRAASTRGLPVSPYPVQPGTAVRAHVVVHKEPDEEGWRPWIGGTWSKWARGTILGYRDFAGREAQPGTYDALSHMLFKPLPSPGSSGGPIVDEESGAVVGVMLGTRMDNRVEGLRGWGVPSETIFEMFGLPGLELKQ